MDGSSSSTSQEMDEQTAANNNQMIDTNEQANHGDDKRFIVKPKRRA
jgi:hypothetical protein